MNFIPGVALLNVHLVSRNMPVVVAIVLGLILSIIIWILGYIFPKWYQGLICRTILFIIVWTALIYGYLYTS